jgi:hypothetical protein
MATEVTARRLPLATIALVVLVGLSVPIGIASRRPFDGLVFLVVLTAVLGWLITRRQPGNRIGLLLVGYCAMLGFYEDAANYAVLDYRLRHGTLPLGMFSLPVCVVFAILKYRLYEHRPPDQPYAVLRTGHRATGRCLRWPGAAGH